MYIRRCNYSYIKEEEEGTAEDEEDEGERKEDELMGGTFASMMFCMVMKFQVDGAVGIKPLSLQYSTRKLLRF